jgi:hypothetical protein
MGSSPANCVVVHVDFSERLHHFYLVAGALCLRVLVPNCCLQSRADTQPASSGASGTTPISVGVGWASLEHISAAKGRPDGCLLARSALCRAACRRQGLRRAALTGKAKQSVTSSVWPTSKPRSCPVTFCGRPSLQCWMILSSTRPSSCTVFTSDAAAVLDAALAPASISRAGGSFLALLLAAPGPCCRNAYCVCVLSGWGRAGMGPRLGTQGSSAQDFSALLGQVPPA